MTGNTASSDHRGWVVYAGILLAIGGVGNLLWGISAVRDAADWTNTYPYTDSTFFGSLETWGWIGIIWAVLLLAAAVLTLYGHSSGRWTGIVVAAVAIVFWFAVLPVLPLFALAGIILIALALYGLTAHWPSDTV